MSFYKCGHERRMIAMDSDALSMAAYFVWKDTTGYDGDKTECWDCYNKQRVDSPVTKRKEVSK